MKTLTECKDELLNLNRLLSKHLCDNVEHCSDCPLAGENNKCFAVLLDHCWGDLDTAIDNIKEKI